MEHFRISFRNLDKSVRIPAYIVRHYAKITGVSVDSAKLTARELMIQEYSLSMDLKKINSHWLSNEMIKKTEQKLEEKGYSLSSST